MTTKLTLKNLLHSKTLLKITIKRFSYTHKPIKIKVKVGEVITAK